MLQQKIDERRWRNVRIETLDRNCGAMLLDGNMPWVHFLIAKRTLVQNIGMAEVEKVVDDIGVIGFHDHPIAS
jgi:hypothetical protein